MADGIVTDHDPGQLADQLGGPLEGVLGPDQTEPPLGVRADQALDAEPLVERVAMLSAPAAGEVDPCERHVAGGGDEPPLGLAVAPPR